MPLNLLLDILIEFMNMILSFFFYHLLNIKSVYFQLIGHENNIGCDKSASNPDAEPLAMDLPSAVNDLSQLLLSTATEVATSIAPTRPKRTSLASSLATSAVLLPPSPERVAKRARALIVERTAAVQAAEEATSDLVTRFTSSRMLREGRGGPGEARCATASSSSSATLVSLATRSTTGKHRFDLF
jgi:hypothetical protein